MTMCDGALGPVPVDLHKITRSEAQGWKRSMHGNWKVLLIMVWFLTPLGCASKQMWYQEGKGQVDYDQDAQQCILIAKEFSRQATMTGKAEDPATYNRTLTNCLLNKGWSMTPSAKVLAGEHKDASASVEPLAVIDQGKFQAFGGQVMLPEQFSFVSSSSNGTGPTIVQTYLFSGPRDTFINVMVQRAMAKDNQFAPTLFRAQPPFFLYEQGWQGTIFCGKMNGQWVMGVGRYYLINKKERITVIVTRSLVEQTSEPEAGFKLSREQFEVVEAFKGEWLPWLTSNVTVPPRPWWSKLPRIF